MALSLTRLSFFPLRFLELSFLASSDTTPLSLCVLEIPHGGLYQEFNNQITLFTTASSNIFTFVLGFLENHFLYFLELLNK